MEESSPTVGVWIDGLVDEGVVETLEVKVEDTVEDFIVILVDGVEVDDSIVDGVIVEDSIVERGMLEDTEVEDGAVQRCVTG